MWQDNFLVASLNGKYLYRVKFDENFNAYFSIPKGYKQIKS